MQRSADSLSAGLLHKTEIATERPATNLERPSAHGSSPWKIRIQPRTDIHRLTASQSTGTRHQLRWNKPNPVTSKGLTALLRGRSPDRSRIFRRHGKTCASGHCSDNPGQVPLQ